MIGIYYNRKVFVIIILCRIIYAEIMTLVGIFALHSSLFINFSEQTTTALRIAKHNF